MTHGRKQAAQTLSRAARRYRVLELRKSGLSSRRIADALGVHHKTVLRDQDWCLDDLARSQRSTTEQYRAFHTARLEELLHAVYTKAIQGNFEAVRTATPLLDQLAKTHGLYTVEPEAVDGAAALLTTPMFGRLIAVFLGVLEGQPEELRIQAADRIAALEDGA